MKKLKYLLLTILVTLLPVFLNALEIEGLYSKNVLVYDLDEDRVLYSIKEDEQKSIASLTKLMTVLVALENIEDLDKEITITWSMLSNVPWDASVAGFYAGDTVTYRDLLYGVMLPSGADAADSLAVSISGSVSSFVDLMNKKAKELGMTKTTFVDTTGYHDGSKSSSKDLVTLLKYALKNSTFKEIYRAKTYKTTNDLNLRATIVAYSKNLPYDLSYVLGSKTGYTDEAGLCLSTLSNIDNENIITITLDAKVDYDMDKHVKDLNNIYTSLKEGYDKVLLIKEGDAFLSLETKYAKESTITFYSKEDIFKYIEGDYNKEELKLDYEGIKIVNYNTEIKTKLGTLKIYYKNELVKEIDILLEEALHFSLLEFIKVNIVFIVIGLIALILTLLRIRVLIRRKKRKKLKRINSVK